MDNLCKILIVDDEYLLRQGIKHLIDWKKEDFEIVGEASNGKEALELIDSLKPHIIISDIVMPVMDGLDFAKIVRARYPEIQVVVLSGYSDFDYVKGTFKLGVNDYILKPKLNPEEFLSLLKNIADNIPNLRISTSKNNNILNINLELNKLISGFDANIAASEEAAAFPDDSFFLIGCNIKRIVENSSISLPALKTLISKAVKTYLNNYSHYELDITKDIYLVLVNFPNKHYDEILRKLHAMLSDISSKCIDIYLILSKTFNSLSKMENTYNNSFRPLLGYKFFFKDKKLISYEDIPMNNFNEKFDFKYYSDQIYLLNILAALNYLKEYIRTSIDHLSISEFELKTLFQNALYNIINILDELHFNVEVMNKSKLEYFQQIDETNSADELLSLLDNIEKDITELLSLNVLQMNDQVISKIIQYISKHYNQQLSLKEIADKFHFNYYYLSSYFSSHIAEGFSEYLNKVRVEKALELLRNEKIPVSEVSYMVGYSDHSYFCKVFKKFTKVTPTKFRKNIISSKRGSYEESN